MNKAREWIKPIFIATALLTFMIWDIKHRVEIDKEIELHGIEVHALVTGVTNVKGYSVNVEYCCYKKKYINHFSISGFEPHTGDSLAIKILPENPGGDLVFKEKFYSIPVVYKSHFDWLHKVNKDL
jgi:hypothetical protein